MTLSMQFTAMVVMVAGGIQAALTFDTYKQLFRPTYLWRQLATDLLFFLTQACILFYFLFLVNGGVLKLYLFLAIMLGVSMYYALFQHTYLRILDRLVRLFRVIVRGLIRLINTLVIRPITWILLQVFALVMLVYLLLQKLVLFIWKVVSWLVKPLIPEKIKKNGLSFLTKCSKIMYKLFIRIRSYFKK